MKEAILNRDKDEVVVHAIKQHHFGMMVIWIIAAMVVVATLVGLALFNSFEENLGLENLSSIVALIGTIFSFFVLIGAGVMTWLYAQNELIITNENIIEITQKGLFHKDISQLNLAKIQDVSASHKGIVSTMLNYGTITIETAGEKESYRFPYCPNASACAKEIIEAHQKYMAEHPTNINNPVNNL